MKPPVFESHADPRDYCAALRLWEAAAWIVSVAKSCRTAHGFAPFQRAINLAAAEAGLVPPMPWVVCCECRRNPGFLGPDEPRRWWSPGEGPTPADYSAVTNGPKHLREALERTPRGSRARREALARWRAAVEAEARRHLGE